MNERNRFDASGDETPVIGGADLGSLEFLRNDNLPELSGSPSLLDASLAILKSRKQNNLQPRARNFDDLSESDKKLLLEDLQEVFGIEPLDGLVP